MGLISRVSSRTYRLLKMPFVRAIIHKTKTHYIIRKLDISEKYEKFSNAATEVYSIRVLSLPSDLRKVCDNNILYDRFYDERGEKILDKYHSLEDLSKDTEANTQESQDENSCQLPLTEAETFEETSIYDTGADKNKRKILLKYPPKFPKEYDVYLPKVRKLEFSLAHRQSKIADGLISVKNLKFLSEEDFEVNAKKQGSEVVSPRLLSNNISPNSSLEDVLESSDITLRNLIENGEETDLTMVSSCASHLRRDSGNSSDGPKFDFTDLLAEFNDISEKSRAGKLSKILPAAIPELVQPRLPQTIPANVPKFCRTPKSSPQKLKRIAKFKAEEAKAKEENSDWFGEGSSKEEQASEVNFKGELDKAMALRNKLCDAEMLKKFDKLEKSLNDKNLEERQAAILLKNFVEMSGTIFEMGK